ncbi:MAG TPA: hypothetical protein VL689_18155 [Paraburkholderia sp.]|jgi:hypothetical protein|nr:hypothetical protein [Paraburkholderia sp.]
MTETPRTPTVTPQPYIPPSTPAGQDHVANKPPTTDSSTADAGAQQKSADRNASSAAPNGSSAAPDVGPSAADTIFGKNVPSRLRSNASRGQREQDVDAFADRVGKQLANIESGSESERNVKFQNARPFMTPAGYFSGGLLAAGYDPNQQIDVRIDSYVGKGHPESKSGSEKRTYQAWEIAAGILGHDRPEEGGVLNFQKMKMSSADAAMVKNLETIGGKLQDSWKKQIADPMRDASGTLATRSGKADAYSVGATLRSLKADKRAFKRLSAEGRRAINRTLRESGQVIIPNVYGYPIAGHAFVPYTPYDGNFEHRPNQGLMLGLNQGTVSEIRGDKDFANWAGRNRDSLLQSFNARDAQGGIDAHWPKAGDVLDNLIAGKSVTYPGYKNILSDQPIPVSELFNYTRARGTDYQLKNGRLGPNGSLASAWQSLNANNAAWQDQTQVFGSAAQNWKKAKGIWGATFGLVPIVGNFGNIVFGAHDSVQGMTQKDRVGGNVGAALSSLQLMHELAPAAAGLAAGGPTPALNVAGGADSAWKFNPKTNEFRFTPPQRINGKVGYPMSPTEPPRLGTATRPNSGETTPREASGSDSDDSFTSAESSRKRHDSFDAPSNDSEGVYDPLIRQKSRKPVNRIQIRKNRARRPSTGSSSSTNSASSASTIRKYRTATNDSADTNPLSAAEVAGFRAYFPGGLSEAESYLKSRSLNLNRSPVFLSSEQYPAPKSWANIPQARLNELMDRYQAVWEPEPKRADYFSDDEFKAAHREYNEKMGQYRENGNFNVQKYWDDMVADQNNKFRTFVDNQTKRLAVATKAYDDFTANPTRYHVKPDDPYSVRKQLTGSHDGKRDGMYLQREALDFSDQSFYKLDNREMTELRSNFLGLFGRDSQRIEAAFSSKKADLENELYRSANTGISREAVEAKKKAIQDRFNGDIETAIKNMDLMYKRIALYGTIGTLSISAISAILWKAIDEIRKPTRP